MKMIIVRPLLTISLNSMSVVGLSEGAAFEKAKITLPVKSNMLTARKTGYLCLRFSETSYRSVENKILV